MSHSATSSHALDVQQGFQQHLAFLAVSDEGDIDGVQRRLDGTAAFCWLESDLQASSNMPAPATAVAPMNSRRFKLIYHFLRTTNLLCWASRKAPATRPI